MKKLLKHTLFSLLILTFASCNTNDKDELIICIEEIVRLLPTTLEIEYNPSDFHFEKHSYAYIYDDANRLVNETYIRQIDYNNDPTVILTTTRKFNYNTEGQLLSINQNYTSNKPTEIEVDNQEKVFDIKYDKTNNTVIYSGNKTFSSTYYLNDKGVPYKVEPTSHSGFLTQYQYDDNRNLVEIALMETETNTVVEKTSRSYNTAFLSPYANSNLPVWYMTTQLDMYIISILNLVTTGKNMIDKETSNSPNSVAHYKVIDHRDCYPTKIEKMIDDFETPYETISITYQEMK